MKKFFTPKDFELCKYSYEDICERANSKLEREGEVIFIEGNYGSKKRISASTHKALLINIELLEKCKHPKEKILRISTNYDDGLKATHSTYECQCGVKVKPTAFEEVK